MNTVFGDTGYWIGLLSPSDLLSDFAWDWTRTHSNTRIVTSGMVLTELLNSFGHRTQYLRIKAAEFVINLRGLEKVSVVPQTSELFDHALTLFSNRPDKQWSLTDCASFVICEREGISEALAHDKHFEQAGIKALLRQD
jgi:predicted nucleic acid-binding protein